jgi:hypothetical protein
MPLNGTTLSWTVTNESEYTESNKSRNAMAFAVV